MSTTLPTRTDLTDYDFVIDLEGTNYTIRLRWNRRDFAWYMDVQEEDGTPIRMSIKVLVDVPLNGRSRDVRFPPGMFIAIDTSGVPHADVVLPEELGARVVLVYFTAAEMAALSAASA